MTASAILVGMSELQAAKGAVVFTCHGIGSCVALCAYDPVAEVGGMAHVMLPRSFDAAGEDHPGKFADTAVPALIKSLHDQGADPSRIVVAYAGGAQVLRFGSGATMSSVGARNCEAIEQAVRSDRLNCVGHDTGGTEGRTIKLSTGTGEVRVWTIAGGERLLCRVR